MLPRISSWPRASSSADGHAAHGRKQILEIERQEHDVGREGVQAARRRQDLLRVLVVAARCRTPARARRAGTRRPGTARADRGRRSSAARSGPGGRPIVAELRPLAVGERGGGGGRVQLDEAIERPRAPPPCRPASLSSRYRSRWASTSAGSRFRTLTDRRLGRGRVARRASAPGQLAADGAAEPQPQRGRRGALDADRAASGKPVGGDQSLGEHRRQRLQLGRLRQLRRPRSASRRPRSIALSAVSRVHISQTPGARRRLMRSARNRSSRRSDLAARQGPAPPRREQPVEHVGHRHEPSSLVGQVPQ